MSLARYMLFAGDTYYPAGGWDDMRGSFATEAEAWAAYRALNAKRYAGFDWVQLVDKETGDVCEVAP